MFMEIPVKRKYRKSDIFDNTSRFLTIKKHDFLILDI